MTEQLIITRIRAMTDLAEVEKQLEYVHSAYLELTSHVRSALADARERFKLSPLFTREDLVEELNELKPETELQMMLVRFEEELRKRRGELKER